MIATPARLMPPVGDATLLSTLRQSVMPSPARSRRSRRRDLVALDRCKKSVEVPLDRCKKSVEVPLDRCKKSSEVDSPADLVTLCRCKKSITPTRSVFELGRDEARAKVHETIAIVERWYDSHDWKP